MPPEKINKAPETFSHLFVILSEIPKTGKKQQDEFEPRK